MTKGKLMALGLVSVINARLSNLCCRFPYYQWVYVENDYNAVLTRKSIELALAPIAKESNNIAICLGEKGVSLLDSFEDGLITAHEYLSQLVLLLEES